jgi:hypothetical protein
VPRLPFRAGQGLSCSGPTTGDAPIDLSLSQGRTYTIKCDPHDAMIRGVGPLGKATPSWKVAAAPGPADFDIYAIGPSLFAFLVGLLGGTAGLIAAATKRGPVEPAPDRSSAIGP